MRARSLVDRNRERATIQQLRAISGPGSGSGPGSSWAVGDVPGRGARKVLPDPGRALSRPLGSGLAKRAREIPERRACGSPRILLQRQQGVVPGGLDPLGRLARVPAGLGPGRRRRGRDTADSLSNQGGGREMARDFGHPDALPGGKWRAPGLFFPFDPSAPRGTHAPLPDRPRTRRGWPGDGAEHARG